MGKVNNLQGLQFNRLTVLHYAGPDAGRNATWSCLCTCGSHVTVRGYDLVVGKTQSCGCLQRERTVEASTTHGHATGGITPEYHSWSGMLSRCYNPRQEHYADYGGRGIRVCARWRGKRGFINFLADMGPRPDGKTLERVKNDLGYSQANCRWATAKEQSRNKRNSRLLTYKGKTQTLADWAVSTGINVTTLHARINRYGWTVAAALSTPVARF